MFRWFRTKIKVHGKRRHGRRFEANDQLSYMTWRRISWATKLPSRIFGILSFWLSHFFLIWIFKWILFNLTELNNFKFWIENQYTPGGTKPRKITYDVIKDHWHRMTSIDLGNVTMSVKTMDVTSQHLFMSKSPAKIPKYARLRRWNSMERKFRLTWPWISGDRSKVIVGMVIKFQGRCKIVQRLGIPSFVAIGRSVRELFSENPTMLHQPSPVPAWAKSGKITWNASGVLRDFRSSDSLSCKTLWRPWHSWERPENWFSYIHISKLYVSIVVNCDTANVCLIFPKRNMIVEW